MPINESRNSRLSISRGASRSSYNSKDPPEFGSQRVPDSREAPLSFSAYLEHFHAKALSDYLHKRETLERELSIFHAAHPRVMEKARLEPNSIEQCRILQTQHNELISNYKIELSSQKRELYSRYERKYINFCHDEHLKARDKAQAEGRGRWSEEWDKSTKHCLEMLDVLKRGTECGREKPHISLVSEGIHARPSSRSSELKATTALSSKHAPDSLNPSLPVPKERIRPRATFVASPRVSIPETRIPSE